MTDSTIPVTDLMDTPSGRDEYGTPDELIERCSRHDVLHRRGDPCLVCEREDGGGA